MGLAADRLSSAPYAFCPRFVMSKKPPLKVFLCAPRGFCAGVVRAIDVVETALRIHGAPVYVRHEIVHNKYVVDSLKAKGVIFIKELKEAPGSDRPVVFSAHGVARSVNAEAEERGLFTIDATCPLVTKVHREALAHYKRGRHVILVGHIGHPEVVGTIGQLPDGAVTLISEASQVDALAVPENQGLAYVTQTTLSVEDTRGVTQALQRRFPDITPPPQGDICYATTNRQEAIKQASKWVDAVIVVGSANSSNSQRLREVAEREGKRIALLVPGVEGIDWALFQGVNSVAITAGASAPEVLVERVLDGFAERFEIEVETLRAADESMFFPLPRDLGDAAGG